MGTTSPWYLSIVAAALQSLVSWSCDLLPVEIAVAGLEGAPFLSLTSSKLDCTSKDLVS